RHSYTCHNSAAYAQFHFEPITIWLSGEHSLDDVPEDDLQHLAAEYQRAVQSHLGADYRLVDRPGQGVMRVRLGITAARQSDHWLDVFEYAVPPAESVRDPPELASTPRALVPPPRTPG